MLLRELNKVVVREKKGQKEKLREGGQREGGQREGN